jgi:hypothetical protein
MARKMMGIVNAALERLIGFLSFFYVKKARLFFPPMSYAAIYSTILKTNLP